MTTAQVGTAIAVAVFVFWVVGAYNRVIRLRSGVVARFAAIDAQCRERQVLLDAQLDALTGAMPAAATRLEALRAACRQADAAREHARAKPGAADAINGLRVAEEVLAEARSRVPVPAAAGAELAAAQARLGETDALLGFARRDFNDAVLSYNAAVQQFPTVLVAFVFGLGPTAIL